MRSALVRLFFVLLLVLAMAANPSGGPHHVYDGSGVYIGDATFGSNTMVYNDNPATSHPPDQSGSWAFGQDNNYHNGTGHTVTFTELSPGCWAWVKTEDSSGNTLDSGTMGTCPQNPV